MPVKTKNYETFELALTAAQYRLLVVSLGYAMARAQERGEEVRYQALRDLSSDLVNVKVVVE